MGRRVSRLFRTLAMFDRSGLQLERTERGTSNSTGGVKKPLLCYGGRRGGRSVEGEGEGERERERETEREKEREGMRKTLRERDTEGIANTGSVEFVDVWAGIPGLPSFAAFCCSRARQ